MKSKLKKAAAIAGATLAAGIAYEGYKDRQYFREIDRKDQAQKLWYSKQRDIIAQRPTFESLSGYDWWD